MAPAPFPFLLIFCLTPFALRLYLPWEVFKPAIRESASAVILVHNHPSGDPTPSQDDKTITKELKAAADTLGIRVLDHVILARDHVLSMVEEKIL